MTDQHSTNSHLPTGVRRHTRTSLLLITAGALLLFGTFIALGCWQIARLSWKTKLIDRVEQRVHAPAAEVPPSTLWNKISAESDEYRHVRVTGVYLPEFSQKVLASTVLGRGYWVMTPLRTGQGSVIWINRGFVRSVAANPDPTGGATPIEVTGLLRINEPGGAFLHHNDPANQRWYSRDVLAMSLTSHLPNAAPFFIDAEASPTSTLQSTVNNNLPVPGLTVIAFNNNHLVYSITWFALAAMVGGAFFYVRRRDSDLERDHEHA